MTTAETAEFVAQGELATKLLMLVNAVRAARHNHNVANAQMCEARAAYEQAAREELRLSRAVDTAINAVDELIRAETIDA